jgi:drug/metabolite transporter (DMT)-like permease
MESENKSHRLKLILAFAAIYLIWGSTYVAIRFTLESIPPFLMAAMRFTIAGILMYGFMRMRGAPRPNRSHLLPTAIMGMLLLVLGSMGVVLAERTVPSGLASLLVTAVPVYIVLIQWFQPGGTAPSRRVLFGLVLGFTGLVLLVGLDRLGLHQSVDLGGVCLILFGCLGSAVGAVYARSAKLPPSLQLAAGMEMIFAGLFLFIPAFFSGEFSYFQHFTITWRAGLAFVYLIGFGSMLAFSAYVWLLHVVNPSLLSTYAYVNPVVAVFLGWLLARESVDTKTLIGAALLLTAVWLITQAKRKPERIAGLEVQRPREVCTVEP